MLQAEVLSILKNSLSITFFVLAMMLLIEYVNVKTEGAFCKRIQRRGWQQILIGVLFGVLPGCLGTYTVVTLYSHNLVSLGALFATFVSTMGDEAFFLFSLDPKTAFIITGILVLIAVIGAVIIDLVYKQPAHDSSERHFEIHKHEDAAEEVRKTSVIENLRHASPHRALLLFGVVLIFILSVLGEIGHSHDIMPGLGFDVAHEHTEEHLDWFSITFIVISLVVAIIVSIVSEHFLETHFWNHIIKKHFLKIFGWTTCIVGIVHALDSWVIVQNFMSEYQWHILVAAVLVGLIPESGPHIIFISLFLSGSIPFSILLANSIVQDGHGGLPLFAESKKMFVFLKAVKAIIALIIGFIGLHFGF